MKYREMRWPCRYPISARLGGVETRVEIVNVAPGGARVEGLSDLPQADIGSELSLRLLDRPVRGRVVWHRAGVTGLRFAQPLGEHELAVIRHAHGAPGRAWAPAAPLREMV